MTSRRVRKTPSAYGECLRLLAEHLRATARQPTPIAGSSDVLDQLDLLVQPHDVTSTVVR